LGHRGRRRGWIGAFDGSLELLEKNQLRTVETVAQGTIPDGTDTLAIRI
jgi:hypothetical protein